MDDSRICKLECERPFMVEEPADLFYLTGLTLSKGRLLIEPNQVTLFVDGRYYEIAKKTAPCSVRLWNEFRPAREGEIGFDSAFITYEGYLALTQEFPSVKWVPNGHPVQHLRVIKEPHEIALLKKAAQLTLNGAEHVSSLLKEGVSEEELAFEFEFYCRRNGASALSFQPIIAFGENGAYPHYRAGKRRLKQGDAVLIDVGAIVDNYCGDMTRLVYFGKPDPRILHLENLVKKAQEMAFRAVKPGVRLGSLDQIVQDVFEKANVKQFYTHSLGHGIGLEVHEFPRIRFDGVDRDVVLKPGMVFTIEPGLYQEGIGGVRLEDMVVVTENGGKKLVTNS